MGWRITSLDAYPKIVDDTIRVKTTSGAASRFLLGRALTFCVVLYFARPADCVQPVTPTPLSVVAIIVIGLLFISELRLFLSVSTTDRLLVDTSRGDQLQINFDVTFPRIPCQYLSLDTMDVSGAHQLDLRRRIHQVRLDSEGRELPRGVDDERSEPAVKTIHQDRHGEADQAADATKGKPACGSCYGAESEPGQCCQTCDEVRRLYHLKGWLINNPNEIAQCREEEEAARTGLDRALSRGEGCRMHGSLEVSKVAGNFHFAPGKSFQHSSVHVHDLAVFDLRKFNVSHRLNRISFGEDFPGAVQPLDGVTKSFREEGGSGMQMYYVKIVPTNYYYLDREQPVQTNQYSVTEHFRSLGLNSPGGGHAGHPQQQNGLPGVFIFYELSPIMVEFRESCNQFAHFVTQLCAILGGVFTVAGIIDRMVYSGMRQMQHKLELGKQG